MIEVGDWTWDKRTELDRVYRASLHEFAERMDDGGWEDPPTRAHEYALLAVAEYASEHERRSSSTGGE